MSQTHRAPIIAVVAIVLFATAVNAQSTVNPPAAAEIAAGYAGFVDDATLHHGVVGGTVRLYLSPRISVGPEIVYMKGPREDRDFFATGNVTFDLRRPRPGRLVTPYLVAGAGLMRHTDAVGVGTYSSSEGAVTGGIGVRAAVSDRWYVGAEWRLGWEPHMRFNAVVGINLMH